MNSRNNNAAIGANYPTPAASQTLKDIYKLCKTNEDAEDGGGGADSDDSESFERANELY